MSIDLKSALRLYLVADPDHVAGDLVATTRSALLGGVTIVQLRVKGRTDREFVDLATSLRAVTAHANVPLLINDRVDIALAVGADGVHLGVDDLPLEDARGLGGGDFIIGYSPETDEQTETAAARGANYLGLGPVFGTATKSDAGFAIGTATISRRATLARTHVIGIGGIRTSNARSVIEAGAIGVAVVSAITKSPDPERAARELHTAIG
jgi:thiamine-phosphate diphosphorylase